VQEPEIRRVTGKREFKQFIDYQYDRNRADARWIPPLRLGEIDKLTPRKNPFFAHADVDLFLAHRDGRVAGRIAAIDDRLHNETHGDNVAAFGFFEADDASVSRALLGHVEQCGPRRGGELGSPTRAGGRAHGRQRALGAIGHRRSLEARRRA